MKFKFGQGVRVKDNIVDIDTTNSFYSGSIGFVRTMLDCDYKTENPERNYEVELIVRDWHTNHKISAIFKEEELELL